MSPEQMRKKSLAMAEADRHARYSKVYGGEGRDEPPQSRAIEASEKRVRAATKKEMDDIDGEGHSINDMRY